MNYIVAAILSNISFAVANNANGVLSKNNKPIKIAIWSSMIGLVLFFIPLVTIFRGDLAKLSVGTLFVMLAINLLVNTGYLFFITGMSRGSVTLTGVIAGSSSVLTAIVAIIFFGEKVSTSQLALITIVLVGMVLASISGSTKDLFDDFKKSGTIFAFGAFVCWGLYYALVRIPIEKVGWFLPQYSSGLTGLIIFTLVAIMSKEKRVLSKPKLLWLIVITAILQILGILFYNFAISKGQTSIVAPIQGSSTAVFVLIAYFVFHEKLNKKQWLGVALSILGIMFLSMTM